MTCHSAVAGKAALLASRLDKVKPRRRVRRKPNLCCPSVALAGVVVLLAPYAAASGAAWIEAARPPAASNEDESDLTLLRETQQAFREVADALTPSLAKIETLGGAQPRGFMPSSDADEPEPSKPRKEFRENVGSNFVVADGPTTGIVYSSDGYIITSSFNFVRDPLLITVTLSNGRRMAAELIARDQVRKIALLKVQATGLETPTWADPVDVRVGEWAVALGLGFGGERPSVTVGIVSALGRMNRNAVQTDAKLSPANYGGPLCDIHGRIIGISVPMAQRPGELAGIEMYDSGVGFVIPKKKVDEIVAVLKTGRSFYRGWLGLQLRRGQGPGVVVGKLADPSPMRSAGVLPGDRIAEANGRPLKHFGHLVQSLYLIPAGESVHLKMDRDGSEYEIDVTLARNIDLGPLPENQPEPFDPSLPTPESSEDK